MDKRTAENDPISMDQAKPCIIRQSHETDLNWDNRSYGLNFSAMFSWIFFIWRRKISRNVCGVQHCACKKKKKIQGKKLCWWHKPISCLAYLPWHRELVFNAILNRFLPAFGCCYPTQSVRVWVKTDTDWYLKADPRLHNILMVSHPSTSSAMKDHPTNKQLKGTLI